MLMEAKSVVIVPGFGMAVANAQHMVASLVKELEKAGVKVRRRRVPRGPLRGVPSTAYLSWVGAALI